MKWISTTTLLAFAVIACAIVRADAPLLNIDSPGRIPGRFVVQFRSEADLIRLPKTGPGSPNLLPQTLPTTYESTKKLADAMAAQVRGQVTEVLTAKSGSAFTIRVVNDADLKDLAKDPRIAFIEQVLSTSH